MAAQWDYIKRIPGTRFLVDGFRFASPDVEAYFLTHAHGDHTTGLSSRIPGPIYCTAVTARLITTELRVRGEHVRAVPLDTPFDVCGVRVVAVDANHCPGACMFLFDVPPGCAAGSAATRILHVGDFRYDGVIHGRSPFLHSVDTVFLDTTYARPKWDFPSQDEAVGAMAEIMQDKRAADPTVAFVCNAYHIGKERCYFGAAILAGARAPLRVWASPARLETLRRLDLPEAWLACLSADKGAADIIVSDQGVGPPALALLAEELLRPVVGFQCTGWSYQASGVRKRVQDGTLSYGIPYSEHSSWSDLCACIRHLKPKRIVPTVNVSDRSSLEEVANRFANFMDLSSSRRHIDRFLTRAGRKRPAPASPALRSSGPLVKSPRAELRVCDTAGSCVSCATPLVPAASGSCECEGSAAECGSTPSTIRRAKQACLRSASGAGPLHCCVRDICEEYDLVDDGGGGYTPLCGSATWPS